VFPAFGAIPHFERSLNLGANARDAMGSTGDLVLAAEAEVLARDNGPGHPVDLQAGSYVRLSVTDTGPGMPPEVLARVAEPFFTTKARGRGAGLGLAMARGFAEQSGGDLLVESEVGRGTTVKLWFPVAKQAPAAAPAEEAGEDAPPLVDAGAGVDLVVTDLSMPGTDGIALIRELHRRRPGLPAILLTGFATGAAELALGGLIGGAFGVCQRSCPVPDQAVSLILRWFVSRSGLRQTSPTGDQLRIWRDHRAGLAARASA
jgi:CheY-like chemotaxis protein